MPPERQILTVIFQIVKPESLGIVACENIKPSVESRVPRQHDGILNFGIEGVEVDVLCVPSAVMIRAIQRSNVMKVRLLYEHAQRS